MQLRCTRVLFLGNYHSTICERESAVAVVTMIIIIIKKKKLLKLLFFANKTTKTNSFLLIY